MKDILKICVTLSVIYISVGDSFLPQQYGQKSQEVRGNINEFLIGLFPDNELETLRQRKFTIEGLERGNR